MEIGPWGLVTLAWGGLTPAFTPEPLLEFPEELVPELPPDLAVELECEPALESAEVAALDLPLSPGGWGAMPPSMGVNPRAIAKIQGARSIVLPVLSVCANQDGHKSASDCTNDHDNRASCTMARTDFPSASDGPC